MSAAHSEGVALLADYHRTNGAKLVVTEPARPRSWPDQWPWDSPDVVAFYNAHRVHADDYKRSVSDVRAQLEKPQVKRPGFAVGLFRSLAVTSEVMAELDGRVPLPSPDWGLRVHDAEGFITYTEPQECHERNHAAEKRILWSQIQTTGAIRSEGQKAQSRGLRAEVEKLVEDAGEMTLKELRRVTGTKKTELDRAIAGSVKIRRSGRPGEEVLTLVQAAAAT